MDAFGAGEGFPSDPADAPWAAGQPSRKVGSVTSYRLDIAEGFAQLLSRLPSSAQQELAQKLLDARELPLALNWSPGDTHPAAMLRCGDHQVLIQLNQSDRAARILAMFIPDRGWVGLT